MMNFYFFRKIFIQTFGLAPKSKKLYEIKQNIYTAILLFVLLFANNISAQITITQPAGAGTEANPYLITSVDNLNWMADQVNNHSNSFAGKWFEQQNDINANISGGSFTPIGRVNPFSGRYDGGGYTISNMYIYLLSNSSIGMFGYTDGAHLQYVFLHANVNGNEKTGAVVGNCKNSTIVVCYSTGSVRSVSGTGGGLVGYSDGSEIKNSYSSSNLSGGGNNTGGLVGYSVSSTIEDCYSIGSNPFSITATAGGLIGAASSTTVTNSFWDTETSGQTKSAGGTGLTTAYMKSPTTYAEAGWFSGWWYMDADFNSGYPYIYLENPGGTQMLHQEVPSGSGTTSEDPYLIANLNNLYWLTKNPDIWVVNAYFEQTADIDASSTSTWYGGSGFTPIGDGLQKFHSIYNGNGHIIDRLFISRSSLQHVGLFGYVWDSTIENLGLTNVDITGHAFVGGLAGTIAYTSVVKYCYCTGNVHGTDWVGGLTGSTNENVSIFLYCYCNVNVNTNGENATSVGGLVGYLFTSCSIKFSYSIGKVTASSSTATLGGLLGSNYGGNTSASFWDTQTSEQSRGVIGTAATTEEMKTENTYPSDFWNFTDDWARSDDKNGGYPYFQWQTFPNTITFTDAGSYTPETPTPGETNQPIGRFALRTSSAGTLDAIWITLYGDFTGVSNYKLWESSDNIFDSSSDILLGTTLSPNLNFGDKIWFTGLFRQLSTSDKYYFLTCDLASDASGEIKPALTGNKDLMFGLGTLGTTIGVVELADDYNALPVELTSFTASVIEEGVQLNWETTTEVNNYGFQVQRKKIKDKSEDEWVDIGFVQGNGTTNSPQSYSFIDVLNLTLNPNLNRIDYRLKQIDNDGTFAYSKVVTVDLSSVTDIEEENIEYEFALEQNYPNPFNPVTSIEYQVSRHEMVVLKVFSVLGKEVTTLVNEPKTPGRYEVQFDGSNFASGMYIYRLHAGEFVQTRKLLLVK